MDAPDAAARRRLREQSRADPHDAGHTAAATQRCAMDARGAGAFDGSASAECARTGDRRSSADARRIVLRRNCRGNGVAADECRRRARRIGRARPRQLGQLCGAPCVADAVGKAQATRRRQTASTLDVRHRGCRTLGVAQAFRARGRRRTRLSDARP